MKISFEGWTQLMSNKRFICLNTWNASFSGFFETQDSNSRDLSMANRRKRGSKSEIKIS